MLAVLFSEFNYVKIKSYGIVVLKKHWYSIKATRIAITDLCIYHIPDRITLRKRSQLSREYFLYRSRPIIQSLIFNRDKEGLIRYLYEEFFRTPLTI